VNNEEKEEKKEGINKLCIVGRAKRKGDRRKERIKGSHPCKMQTGPSVRIGIRWTRCEDKNSNIEDKGVANNAQLGFVHLVDPLVMKVDD
jgi:hypothetical protein